MAVRTLLTFKQFSEKHPAFTMGSLRTLRFYDETNGFKSAFVRVQGRVLIDEERFFECVDKGNDLAA